MGPRSKPFGKTKNDKSSSQDDEKYELVEEEIERELEAAKEEEEGKEKEGEGDAEEGAEKRAAKNRAERGAGGRGRQRMWERKTISRNQRKETGASKGNCTV